ncbi:MAG: GNAT family N-acetyltransferase [Acidobacteria bacterium]|nr:GNAT family N-acetyltransferase [Acidobacteriota bacterium]
MDVTTAGTLRIERATERDVPLILRLIKALAEYERMSDEVIATEDGLRRTLFGPHPAAEVVVGYAGDEPAGFALLFHNYSTFLGKPGLYLEDLFVVPTFRGRGYGKALLVHLAKLAVERDCGRFEWSVLDWNDPAIGFYKKLGATPMDGWTIFRVTGDALRELAAS